MDRAIKRRSPTRQIGGDWVRNALRRNRMRFPRPSPSPRRRRSTFRQRPRAGRPSRRHSENAPPGAASHVASGPRARGARLSLRSELEALHALSRRSVPARRRGGCGVLDRLSSPAVRVAILDSGIDYLHPELVGLVDLSRARSFMPEEDALVAARARRSSTPQRGSALGGIESLATPVPCVRDARFGENRCRVRRVISRARPARRRTSDQGSEHEPADSRRLG